jgi:hypothetical protein
MSKYFFNNKPYPRVTEILKLVSDEKGLEAWRKRTKNHAEISKRATTLGSIMHYCIANSLSEVPIEMDNVLPMDEWPEDTEEEMAGRMNQFRSLRLRIAPNPVLEHVIHHDTPGEYFAGTLDFRGTVNDEHTIMDFKGSTRIRPEYEIQLGAYYLGSLREGYTATRAFIIRLQRNERELLELDHTQLVEASEKFLDLAKAWHKDERNLNKGKQEGI